LFVCLLFVATVFNFVAALSVSPDQRDEESVKKIEISIAYRHLLKQPQQFIDSILTNCFI
jgi:hypothetical protein